MNDDNFIVYLKYLYEFDLRLLLYNVQFSITIYMIVANLIAYQKFKKDCLTNDCCTFECRSPTTKLI